MVRPFKYPPCPDHGGVYQRGCDHCKARQRARVWANRSDRLASGDVQHGTRSAYDAGCRCVPCKIGRSRIKPDLPPPQEGLSQRNIDRSKGRRVTVILYNDRQFTGTLIDASFGVFTLRSGGEILHIPVGRVRVLTRKQVDPPQAVHLRAA